MAKSFITAGFVLLFVFLAMPAHAENGQSAYKQGTDLEARQNYEGAYEAYQKAYDADPQNTRYRAALTGIRFLAAASKVHRAALLQQAGSLEEALALFEQALSIDPSSPMASQQVTNTGMVSNVPEKSALPPASSGRNALIRQAPTLGAR